MNRIFIWNVANAEYRKGQRRTKRAGSFEKKGRVKLVHNNDTSSFCKMNTLYFIWVRVNKPKVIVEILKDEKIFLKPESVITSLPKQSKYLIETSRAIK